MIDEKTYRIFISYSHDDSDLADKIVAVLRKNGLQPMLDKSFSISSGFHDQIKNYIAHAHVFMPIITHNSSFWVHQEIGYAKALDIPVVPVSFEQDPGQMISDRQAVQWDNSPDWIEKNKDKLSFDEFAKVVLESQQDTRPLYECAGLQEQRTDTIVKYANKVIALGGQGHVRQKGALSSFHIPNEHINHPVWRERYGEIEVSQLRRQLQWKERIVLQKHAEACGCSLIIDPTLTYGKYGRQARASRLRKSLLIWFKPPQGADNGQRR